MDDFQKNKKLSDKTHWDKVVGSVKLPRIYDREQFNIRRFDQLFSTHLQNDAKTIFEVGCGSSGWLPYFKIFYGLKVSGLDYSHIGCKIAEKNLEFFGRAPDEAIHCADVTKIKTDEFGCHDIVFSYGLIEHFDDPVQIVGAMGKLAKEDGQIITIVPNLAGFYGVISRIFMPKIYAMHKVINPEQLEMIHRESGFLKDFCGYYGTFYLYAIPWANTEPGFFQQPLIKRIFMKLIDISARISEAVLNRLRITRETSVFSPYVVYIGHKEI